MPTLVQLLESGRLVVLTSRCGRGRVVPIYSGDLKESHCTR